jgi:hypothetical protein
VKRIGAELGLQVVDLRGPLLEINRRGQSLRPDFTVVGPDRVHPEAPAHLAMTYLLLKARGETGEVARVGVDMPRGDVREAANCRIDDCRVTPDGAAFLYHAESLPFPVEDAARAALDWVPFTESCNREIVRVTGLSVGVHRLEIDGGFVCAASHEEWAAGIDIATCVSTPQNLQARRVLALGRKRWELIWKRRDLIMVECQAAPEGWTARPKMEQVLPLLDARLQSAAGKDWEGFFRRTGEAYPTSRRLDAEWADRIDELYVEMQREARPVPHRFLLTAV